jgi:hypothetical protein
MVVDTGYEQEAYPTNGQPHGRSLDRHHTGDFSRPVAITQLNAANRSFWARRSVIPSVDSCGRMHWRGGDAAPGARTTALRDAIYEPRAATTPREQLAALNRGARAFWSGTAEPPTVAGDALRKLPAPTSNAELNQCNRAFWSGRI